MATSRWIAPLLILFTCDSLALADTFGSGANTFDIEFVSIGNPNNAADTTGNPNPAGKVDYAYRMGKFEISEQMIDKANSLGGLGITKTIRGPDKPSTDVSWNEAARFVNWLNTIAGSTPAYKFAFQPGEVGYNANADIELWTFGDAGYNPTNLYRNSLARYFLPSAHEWYKAAYYDPASGVYYDFPTGSDSIPDGIDFVGDLNFDAVFCDGCAGLGGPNDITNVGLLSAYGTAGQGGNVAEWEETKFTLLNNLSPPTVRGVRGGYWNDLSYYLSSSERSFGTPGGEGDSRGGFRVASIAVPEPSTLLLIGMGSLAVFWRKRGLVCASILIVLLASPVPTVHAAEIRTVALSGQQVPGAPDDVNFGGFGLPVLNDAGQTAFYAASGTTGQLADSIWSEGSGSLALVARNGQQIPGMPDGVNFGISEGSGRMVINDAGQTTFFSIINGVGTYTQAIWSDRSGSLHLVAPTGDHAPGTPSGVIFSRDLTNYCLNNAGQTAFRANLTGSGVSLDGGIWSEGSGTLALVARNGDQAPGTASGANFSSISAGSLTLNDSGHTAFVAGLIGGGVNSTNNSGVWSDRSGSLSLVVRRGDQAPGAPSGVNFNNFNCCTPVLNNAGQVAIFAILTGSGVDATNNQGIWSERFGSLGLVARSGDQAPGLPSGAIFSTFGQQVVLNNSDHTAFYAVLSGSGVDSTNNSGIWSEGSGSLALVAREGNQAPGTPSGVVFSSLLGSNRLVLNEAGQIAFFGSVAGNGVDLTNGDGIWATDRSGQLQLIARKGDLLEVAPGDFRTISDGRPFFGSTGNSDGRPSFFNNRGQLAFRAQFTDGTSGIFVSNRVAVPEPSTLFLFFWGSAAFLAVKCH